MMRETGLVSAPSHTLMFIELLSRRLMTASLPRAISDLTRSSLAIAWRVGRYMTRCRYAPIGILRAFRPIRGHPIAYLLPWSHAVLINYNASHDSPAYADTRRAIN